MELIRGVSFSLLLHSMLLLLVGVAVPMFFERERPLEPPAITVELVPVKEISNLPTSRKPIAKKPPKPKPTPPKPEPKPAPRPKAEPEHAKPVAPPKPAPKKEKKAKPKPTPKPKAAKKPDAFEEVLKDLTKEAANESDRETASEPNPQTTQSKSERYDPQIPLSISEKDAIRSQFYKHWNVSMLAGAKDNYTLAVEVRLIINRDGTVQRAELMPGQQHKYASNPFFRAAADSAIRAVQLASPLKNLPPEKYSTWRETIISFDPRDMLY